VLLWFTLAKIGQFWFGFEEKPAVSVQWSVFRECCGQWTLSGVFKAGVISVAILVGDC